MKKRSGLTHFWWKKITMHFSSWQIRTFYVDIWSLVYFCCNEYIYLSPKYFVFRTNPGIFFVYFWSFQTSMHFSNKLILKRSGCGSVGRAVAFDTRGPRFDSSHRQNFIEHLFIINCIEKTKIIKKRPGMAHFFF